MHNIYCSFTETYKRIRRVPCVGFIFSSNFEGVRWCVYILLPVYRNTRKDLDFTEFGRQLQKAGFLAYFLLKLLIYKFSFHFLEKIKFPNNILLPLEYLLQSLFKTFCSCFSIQRVMSFSYSAYIVIQLQPNHLTSWVTPNPPIFNSTFNIFLSATHPSWYLRNRQGHKYHILVRWQKRYVAFLFNVPF